MTLESQTYFKKALAIVITAFCLNAHADTTTTNNEASKPGDTEKPTQSVLPLEDLRVFTKTYEHIRNAYIKDIDDKTLLEYAIRGMLQELDPHSAYLDESTYEDLQRHTTGEFGGLGIEVGMEDGFIKVISPIDDTPAYKAGIEAGDLIIKLDGIAVKGLTLNDAVKKMRGPKGSEINLTIAREGADQPLEIKIIRDTIKAKSVRHEVLENEYGYIRIAQFQIDTGGETKRAVETLLEEKDLKGIVLDLRNNPGGVLQSSVSVTDVFLDGGTVVYTEGRLKQANEKFFANKGDATGGLPLVVLINDGSASASEIVSGALQDHKRALIVGTRSFGKGSVQTVIPITEDKAVKMTTALYFTPNGRSIQAQGIEPDIRIDRARVTAYKNRLQITEAELSGHLSNAKGGKDVDAEQRESEKDRGEDSLQNRDNQLYEALNLLKGLNIFKQSLEKTTHDATQIQEDAAQG